MVGFNIWQKDPKKLNASMTEEKLNWRSFVFDESIYKKWNRPATPLFYVIDHKGIIRRKWVGAPGAKAIDTAVEKLIEAVK